MLQTGRVTELVFFVFIVLAMYVAINRFRKSEIMPIRRLPGLDAVDEAIGRCTEMGKPVHFTTGLGELVADTFAAFGVLQYVAEQTARYDTDLIVTNARPMVHPITEDIVRESYRRQGKLDAFKADNIRYLSDTQSAYLSGVFGIMEREGIGANIMMGYFFAEALQLAEVGNRVGAIQVAGTASTPQLPFFVAACDYTLIGEELFAAGAYLTRDPVRVGALVAQDITKFLTLGLLAVGTVAITLGSDWFKQILQK